MATKILTKLPDKPKFGKYKVKEGGKIYEVTVQDNGTKEWRLNGQIHREDGPAIEWADGAKYWFKNSQLHREDGPAVERADGTKYWYLNGINYSEAEFKAKKKHIIINQPYKSKSYNTGGVKPAAKKQNTSDITSLKQININNLNDIKKVFGKDPSNPPTDLGRNIKDTINSWLDDSNNETSVNLKKYEPLFQQAKKVYPLSFVPPNKDVYRGLKKKMNELIPFIRKHIKNKTLKKINIDSRSFYVIEGSLFVYKAHRDCQSWTTAPLIAKGFIDEGLNEKVPIIIKTKVDNNFIFNPKYIDKIGTYGESETISFKKDRKVSILIPENTMKDLLLHIHSTK